MRIAFVASAMALSLAGVATAQEARTFDGPYVGGLAGWQQDRVNATVGQGRETESDSANISGFSYGVVAGYNFNINGNGVLGVEGVLSGSTGRLRDEEELISLNIGRSFELAGRAGALISPKTLVFGRLGWTNARFSLPVSDIANLGANRNGFTVGAGIEHLVTDQMSLRVEYAYSDYERFRSGIAVAPGVIETYSLRPTRNAVRAGVSFNF